MLHSLAWLSEVAPVPEKETTVQFVFKEITVAAAQGRSAFVVQRRVREY